MGRVIILTDTTIEPITMIGEMSGLCWGADTKNHEKNYARGLDCIRCNHGRTLEFPQIYMLIDGFSARVIREIYTHIGGAPTRLQESTRYVDGSNFEYIIPSTIKNNPSAVEIFKKHMEDTKDVITQLTEVGIPREDIANILPLGMESKMILRTNLRNFIDMSHQRLCKRAYWEFRDFMNQAIDSLAFYAEEWKILVNEENLFVPKCEVLGYCPERYSCHRKPDKATFDHIIELGTSVDHGVVSMGGFKE